MRARDPRRLLARRREARVRIVDPPHAEAGLEGSVTSMQVADVTLPASELDRLWTPEHLERLARTYWLFLTRVSLGLLRVLYTPDSREVVLVRRPFRLLTFHAPIYDIRQNRGSVTWPIDRGILVAPNGRSRGFLRLSVRRPDEASGELVTIRVTSEVSNFYPAIAAGWLPGVLARIGAFVYRVTQLRIHVIVTNAFLRSLARLELYPSVVGQLTPAALETVGGSAPGADVASGGRAASGR
ncbi:MAG: hypothetical protein JOZ25_09040 [Actinobacteria bacterium]|nr:hypothetical protein [Actinomycetota bacterium]